MCVSVLPPHSNSSLIPHHRPSPVCPHRVPSLAKDHTPTRTRLPHRRSRRCLLRTAVPAARVHHPTGERRGRVRAHHPALLSCGATDMEPPPSGKCRPWRGAAPAGPGWTWVGPRGAVLPPVVPSTVLPWCTFPVIHLTQSTKRRTVCHHV